MAFSQQKAAFNQTLVDSLTNWAKIDQTAATIKPQTGRFKNMTVKQWQAYQDSVFGTHQKLLSKIFDQYGYPGYDLVGKQGSNNYWLMVQHSDKTPAFQLKVLEAMKKEVDKGNADAKNYAYLVDRVKINAGEKAGLWYPGYLQ